jgi:peroxiredoxin
MMTKNWLMRVFCGAALLTASAAMAQAVVGRPAPNFSATAASGEPIGLSDFKGKFVVLEWANPECPFTGKHYNSGNMPATQKAAMAKGVAWVSIETAATGGHDETARRELQAWLKSKNAAPTAAVVDSDGKIARAYKATATPHMFVINPTGTLIYAGAIDSKATANPADIKAATNYVSQALDEAMSGKAVSHPVSQAYGCAVEYPRGS